MNLEVALQQALASYGQGNLHQAEVLCRQVLKQNDRVAGAWHLLALLAERAGHDADAGQFVQRAIDLAPHEPPIWNTQATLYEHQGELRRAEQCLREAIRLQPNYAIGYNNLGEVLKRYGRQSEATPAYRQAIELVPDFAAARSNLLMSLLYDPTLAGSEVTAEHRRLAAWWGEKYTPRCRYENDPNPARPIRVGYVSPDLREHAVMRFFEPLLAAHDRSQFEIFLYSECPKIDHVGQRLRNLGDNWRITWGRSASAVADLIERDRIDLLIDLAGHTRNNRLDVMALRPAPVQITALGYPSITGLSAIDYRLTDNVLDPPGNAVSCEEAEASNERLIWLAAGYACFKPPSEEIAIAPAPSRQAGFVRFVSHHPLIKLNDQVLTCWQEILTRMPSAQLTFFRSDLRGDAAEQLRNVLERHQFPMDRVELIAVSNAPADYLRQYQTADLVLDAFPFNGHTMTCEALWMGVPVVTLRGDRPAARLTASVLEALALPELIAASPREYIERAVAWANDETGRGELRTQLGQLVLDRLAPRRWTEDYETALRQCWRQWCGSAAKQRSTLHARQQSNVAKTSANAPPGVSNNDDVATILRQAEAQRAAGNIEQAANLYRQAGSSRAFARLGELCEEQGNIVEAKTAYETASRLEPWVGEHPLRLGNLHTALGQYAQAAQQYRQAVAVEPQCFPAWAMMGQGFANEGRLQEAEQAYRRALAVRRDPKVLVVLATLLPPIYRSAAEVAEFQTRLQRQLQQLHTEGVRIDPTREIVPNLFMLAYQGGDVREIQRSFARLFQPPPEAVAPRRIKPSSDGRIRVGILSEYLCNHTIGTLNSGLVAHLDRKQFHLTVISAARGDDLTARHYRSHADRFVRLSHNLGTALATLRDLDLDILFYPDLGMSCLTLTLACSRLAPVQCVGWGHPLTTGLPTIDYFLSGELYEVPEADEHYTERLVRLWGLQTCYPRPAAPVRDRGREHFNLPTDAHLYGCPQTLFKFHPEFDALLAGILRRDPRGLLVLIEGKHPHWNELLRRRWAESMPDVCDRIRFLPALPRDDFVALSQVVDVLLDPGQFGGGNTTLEALAVGTPVVTWPTPFLRSRLAAGMYRHIDWANCTAASAEQYVEMAVRFGAEPDANRAARQEIAERSGALFEHVDSVRAYQEFFTAAFETHRSPARSCKILPAARKLREPS